MEAKSSQLYSLRKRALYLSAVISVVVLLILAFAYSKLNETNEKAITNAQNRTVLLTVLSHIRADLLAAYQGLNNFLLTPEKIEYKKKVQLLIQNTINTSQQLQDKPFSRDTLVAEKAALLKVKLATLHNEIQHLFSIRLDSARLYPSLAVAAEYMRPNRVKMNSLMGIVKYEMQQDETIKTAPDVYETFINTRYLWGKMLSNFRIYLANRTGFFDQHLLTRQEEDLVIRYKELNKSLTALTTLAEQGRLGFESTYAVKEMKAASELWFEGFTRIKVIHHSDNWRLDALIMKNKITPTLDGIVILLSDLEKTASVSAEEDFISFKKLGKAQNNLLWIIAILGIIFVVIIILSLDSFIFKPITQVVSALKSEALGKKGEIIPLVKSQEAYDLVSAFSEMSRQVHLRQSELEHRALHDALTALPNRTLLLDRMEHDINTAKRESQQLCLLMLDLDRFKEVNDTLGHSVGDQLLIILGERLTRVLRDVDTVARFGGDEFAILLPHTDGQQAKKIAEKILAALKDVVLIEGIELYITASIGIAVYPQHCASVQDLLRLADIAMYVAKRNKTGFEVYRADDDENSLSRLSLTNALRDALDNNLLDVYYQPVINIKKNKIVGVEALSRWFHPELGTIPPDTFISLAEQTGIINELTYRVLEQSISRLMQWHKLNADLYVAVNISVYSFREPLFVSHIRQILEKFNFPYEKLTLEITEGAMMENPLQAVDILSELRQMGVKLAVDDFGTGYSSMAYLKQLPIHELKIDKSFVLGLHEDKSDEAIVRSTIELAHNLNLRVVAEGVETETAWELLQQFDCDVAQGYYMSKPKSAEDIERQLTDESGKQVK